MAEEVIVAGAGFAGLNAAFELAEKGYDVELIDSSGSHSFTPSAPDVISGTDPNDLRLELADFLSETPIDFTREKILRINPEESVVETNSGSHSYENLVLALGHESSSFGMDISELDTVYSVDQAEDVAKKVEDADDAIVVGCGYVGVEVAGEFYEEGLDVKVVDQVTRPMPNSCELMSEKILDVLNEKDVAFQGGRGVESVEGRKLVFEDGEAETADIVVWAVGMEASHVVQRSFDCGPEGLKVNGGLNSEEHGDVFAAGACADTESPETAQNAMEHASVIAENIDRADSESLERFEAGEKPFIVTVGEEAVLEYGDSAYRSKLFRYLKRLIRTKHWMSLSWKKLRLRF
jgi:NADH dehydrogenase